jgi:putative DNA primase/helicase
MFRFVGLRPYKTAAGINKLKEKLFPQIAIEDLTQFFDNPDSYVSLVPKEEQWNLYFTASSVTGDGAKRKFEWQDVIPIDVDNIDPHRIDETINAVIPALGLEFNKTAILFSGHGLQMFVKVRDPWDKEGYFNTHRAAYKVWVDRAQKALEAAGLPGEMDSSVWSPGRLMRTPGTINRKKDRPEVTSFMIQTQLVAIDFDWPEMMGVRSVSSDTYIMPSELKSFPTPDTEAVLEECEFLKWCNKYQADVKEPQWYAMLSITANSYGHKTPMQRDRGASLTHEYSKKHPNYDYDNTQAKLEQALKKSGPRTCANINSLWDGCKNCKHFGSDLKSPIMIRGENYIKTKDTGFYSMAVSSDGRIVRGKPCFEDLVKYFDQQYNFITSVNKTCHIYDGKKWVELPDSLIEAFAQDHFEPAANTAMTKEFLNLVYRKNIRQEDWFISTTFGKINFNNGVYDIASNELKPHSREFGFTYCLPYDYDPKATAPRFEQFLKEVTDGDEQLIDVLLEYAGYCFSFSECKYQKALILEGDGKNGKSVFLDLMKHLAGEDNVSSLSMLDLGNDLGRSLLENKLFNISEETPANSLKDTSIFKNLVTGGTVTVRRLYKGIKQINNRAKFIFACNELPRNYDQTYGLYRRFIIVPFDVVFDGPREDKDIKTKLFAERSGIFNLIIQGWKRLEKQGRFSESESIERKLNEYRLDSNDVFSFMDEYEYVFKPNSFVEQDKLYEEYRSHCIQSGIADRFIRTKSTFSKYVIKTYKGVEIERRRFADGQKRIRFYKNIGKLGEQDGQTETF